MNRAQRGRWRSDFRSSQRKNTNSNTKQKDISSQDKTKDNNSNYENNKNNFTTKNINHKNQSSNHSYSSSSKYKKNKTKKENQHENYKIKNKPNHQNKNKITLQNNSFHSQSLQQIISGGQTGADRGALEGASSIGIPTGGFAPKGFKTSAGNDLTLKTKFNLVELNTGNYATRDRANVKEADAMVAFRLRIPKTGRGTEKTINYMRGGLYRHIELENPSQGDDVMELLPYNDSTGHKGPVLVLWDINEQNVELFSKAIRDFIDRHEIRILLVGGPCGFTLEDIEENVANVIYKAFNKTLN